MSDFELDAELLEGFSEEIKVLQTELRECVAKLTQNVKQPQLFELGGQIVDRIYGTAATCGFNQLAEYCKSIKEIAYRASQADNMYAQNQVLEIFKNCEKLMAQFAVAVKDPTKLKKALYVMGKEKDVIENLGRTVLRNQRKKTVG